MQDVSRRGPRVLEGVAMGGEARPVGRGDRFGDSALAAGIAAFIAAFVPVIGDFIAAPTAVVGVGLGLVGIRRFETGRAMRVAPAAVGTVLSVCAGLTVLFVLVATADP